MKRDNSTLLIIGAVVLGLYLYSKSRIGGLSPLGGPQLGYRTSPSGTLVNVPGVGGFSSGPSGTSVVLDPRLFGGLFGTTSGAGAFHPGSGTQSPLLPQVGGGAGDVSGVGVSAGFDAGLTTQADGTMIGLPSPQIPPETPTQVPVDPTAADPSAIDPNMIPSMIPSDPTTLDPGMVPQLFDPSVSMAY
jgi:hypothetical protein